MQFRSGPARAAFFCFGLTLAHAGCAVATPVTLEFEKVFSTAKEPATLHYQAVYEDARGRHELEVWREGQHRLRRRTDHALDVLAEREKDGEVKLTVFDHNRRIRTDISRSSLYRVGQFTDWFGLAHGIRKPAASYMLTRLAYAPGGEATTFPCRWYALESGEQRSRICWNNTVGLPIAITDAAGHVRWKILAAASGADAVSPSQFQVGDAGYIHVNADDDIQAD